MTDWTHPQEVSEAALAFGDITGLIPDMEEIPNEFKQFPGTPWNQFQNDWFFNGLKNPRFIPKPEIDPELALRHLGVIQRSFAPSHEQKSAAVAWLASLWFVQVRAGGKKYP